MFKLIVPSSSDYLPYVPWLILFQGVQLGLECCLLCGQDRFSPYSRSLRSAPDFARAGPCFILCLLYFPLIKVITVQVGPRPHQLVMFGPIDVRVDGCMVETFLSAVRSLILPVVHWFGLTTASASAATSVTTSFFVAIVVEGAAVVGRCGR